MVRSEIQRLINEALSENPDLFLVDWTLSSANKIDVLIDGDNGLPIEEVVRISRHIEHNLDREKEDFSLTVSSPGLSRPLEIPRQYIKNIGRKLKVNTEDKELKGTITGANEESVTITWKTREPKPIGKGKHTVQKEEIIPYHLIKKAIIQVEI